MSKLRRRLEKPASQQKPLSPDNQRKLEHAFALHQSGRFLEAEPFYRDILKTNPNNFDCLHFLGVVCTQRELHDEAILLLSKAVRINPKWAFAQNNLGLAFFKLKRFGEALEAFQRAIDLDPNLAEAYNNLGGALLKFANPQLALEAADKALALNPNYADAANTRGVALWELARPEEALEFGHMAARLNPRLPEAYNTLGMAYQSLSRLNEALQSFDYALSLRPNYADALRGRAETLLGMLRGEEALASIDAAIALSPEIPQFHNARGHIMTTRRDIRGAVESYQRVLDLNPEYPFLAGLCTQTRLMLCDWTRYEEITTSCCEQLLNHRKVSAPFAALGLFDSPEAHRFAATAFGYTMAPRQSTYPAPNPPAGEKVKIGYYSADFFNHATSYLMVELLEAHDLNKFEIHLFAFGPDVRDEMRERLSKCATAFHDVHGKSNHDVAQLSREMGIEIAIDLKGYTANARPGIFAHGCAPIQAQYLGYPGTMGVDFIQYVIADEQIIPTSEFQNYDEKVVWLPGSYQVNDSTRRISDKAFSRTDLGLPVDGFVFCCFNNNYKITPDVFDCWMEILNAIPGSVFWLLRDNDSVYQNLRREAAARGVDPDRLVFAPRMPLDEHLARHRCADLFLDTLPYNAHTTASDALWAGLPVLTRPGRSFASRVGASLLTAIGLPELIVETREDYIALAVELARNPARLADIKARLAKNRETSDLFSGKAFARKIERAYEMMMERHWAGLPPDHIRVPG